MLVAMAITLVMMGAVVTLFANISNSVRNRRATTEMSGQLRHVRNVLQQDLQGATCPGVTWQRSEANHGYIEIIEGQYREGYATNLIDADPNSSRSVTWPPTPINPEIDHKVSTLPSSNLPFNDPNWATDAGGLGDADDILMLTVRNEHEPFNGRAPTNVRLNATSAASLTSMNRRRPGATKVFNRRWPRSCGLRLRIRDIQTTRRRPIQRRITSSASRVFGRFIGGRC